MPRSVESYCWQLQLSMRAFPRAMARLIVTVTICGNSEQEHESLKYRNDYDSYVAVDHMEKGWSVTPIPPTGDSWAFE